MSKRNIVLIGMPGAGKSTVGVLLAKSYKMPCIDTDLLIQQQDVITSYSIHYTKLYETRPFPNAEHQKL